MTDEAPFFDFRCQGHSAEQLAAFRFRAVELLSRPFAVQVLCAAPADLDLEPGGTGALALSSDGEVVRRFRGVVARVRRRTDVRPHKAAGYLEVKLVPRLWTLGLTRRSRIFQDATVPAVVKSVLDGHGIDCGFTFVRDYPARQYVVQYRETDLQFVQRLLASEGIFYWCEDGDDAEPRERVRLCDSSDLCESVGAPRVPFRQPSALSGAEHYFDQFGGEEQLRPRSLTLRGYDFQRALTVLEAEGSEPRAGHESRHYDHAPAWNGWRVSDASARVGLEQLRVGSQHCTAAGTAMGLKLGHWFELCDHPKDDWNRRYTVRALRHHGQRPELHRATREVRRPYSNQISCVAAGVPLRPRPPLRRPRQVLEPARVVGPPGEEIHTDEHGRIKVRFYWDEEGPNDDHASCWVRTAMAPWAGPAFGFQFVPRVGMEVIVGFMDADNDEPLVLGATYNGVNKPPFALPQDKTRGGIRTHSVSAEGHNELSFEDAPGREQVFLRAERDLDELVRRNRTREVGGSELTSVAETRFIEVHGDQQRVIHGNDVTTVHKNMVLHVVGKQLIIIDSEETGADASAPQGSPKTAKNLPVLPGMVDAYDAELVAALADETPATVPPFEPGLCATAMWSLAQLEPQHGEHVAALEGHVTWAESVMGYLATERAVLAERGAMIAKKPGGVPPDVLTRERARVDALEAVSREIERALDARRAALAEAPSELGRGKDLVAGLLDKASHENTAIGVAAAEMGRQLDDWGVARRQGGSGEGGGGGDNVFTKDERVGSFDPSADPNEVKVEGSKLSVAGPGEIQSETGLRLVVGGSSIELTPGEITISAPVVTINGAPIKLNC
jgi:type VI secretion system secreted protein VgrG